MVQSPQLIECAMLWPGDRFEGNDSVLCLNFVNTVSWRGKPDPSDHLKGPEDWVAWIEEQRSLPSEALAELKRRASMWPFEAESAFSRAIEFRESLYRLLRAFIDGAELAEKATFDELFSQAMERTGLVADSSGWSWKFEPMPVDWETPLLPIALSAAQLLTSSAGKKLRFCERDECQWLFLDFTKNHSRKWCDMASCGNVMKARRSYARRKTTPSGRPDRSESPLR